LLAFREGRDLDDEQFMHEFSERVSASVFSLIRQHRIELLLILECSTGTKYAGVKNTLIETLAAYFIENMQKTAAARVDALRQHSFLMRVLAMNLIQGLIEISRQYPDDAWVEKNIKSLLRYHIGGMMQFFS
jgi:hypothetical protein